MWVCWCYHSAQNFLYSRLLSRNLTIIIHKTTILPTVLCVYETWSLLSRVFENRVLRRVFERNRDDIIGGWRRWHNEELYDLCFSPNRINVIKSGGLDKHDM
jgi:hypothetical protein